MGFPNPDRPNANSVWEKEIFGPPPSMSGTAQGVFINSIMLLWVCELNVYFLKAQLELRVQFQEHTVRFAT